MLNTCCKCIKPDFHIFHELYEYYIPIIVGYAKNKAVCQSSGKHLCFLDSVSKFLAPFFQKELFEVLPLL